MFSRRTPRDLQPNSLARARAALSSVPYDLTVSNPTVVGIEYPREPPVSISGGETLVYRPDPQGLASARCAVADEYRRRHGVAVDPERIVLCASTSEAYGWLFKLLCDPGEAVLVPAPSYPLFEHLAILEGVRAETYRLEEAHAWRPEPIGPRVRSMTESGKAAPRALVTVHPNNPTGSLLAEAAADDLTHACVEQGMALIVDEVFLDYPLRPGLEPRSFVGSAEALTFCLGGLSKSIGLPQLKLAWIVVGGPEQLARETLERLQFVADQYLSVAAPVQQALGEVLSVGASVRSRIRQRCMTNLAALRAAIAERPSWSLVEPDGGWSAVVRFPSVVDEETLALRLLERYGVAVHPGYFFDFPSNGWLVLGLLPEPDVFREGVHRVFWGHSTFVPHMG